MTDRTLRVGFVIDGRLPSWSRPWQMLFGSPSHSAVGEMRFGWIAHHLNADPARQAHYSLYRPGRDYDAVVFLKSMGAAHQHLARSLRERGTRVIFDVNVDYFSEAQGTFYYQGMAPTPQQVDDAHRMAELSDALIADSSHLATIAAKHHPQVRWISDNVDMRLAGPRLPQMNRDDRIDLLWSGEAVKLFELLSIEDVLRRFSDRARLWIVTNSLSALDRWFEPWKSRFESLLQAVEHEIIPFRSVAELLRIYRYGGVFISPRFLDNTYNFGHTEWKIALPMASGCPALGSPLPSYQDVATRSNGVGLRLCADTDAWTAAFEEILSGAMNLESEGEAARAVIDEYYSTPVVAKAHCEFVSHVCDHAAR